MSGVLRQCGGRWVAMGLGVATIGGVLLVSRVPGADVPGPQGPVFTVTNESGLARTINAAGFPVVADANPFFQDLGVNGRRCVTCHQPADNMTVSPASIQARFEATGGTDPIFRPNDGANWPSPTCRRSTRGGRRTACC